MENIDSVQKKHFAHRTQQNFWHNFKDFAAAYNFELGLARAIREPNEDKMSI
jgi:hypothetical protein